MFDSICIRRQNVLESPTDLGFLAQALMFYREVHVVADPGMLTYLARTVGADSLRAAIRHGLLRLSFTESLLGVQTIDSNGRREHRLVSVTSPKTALEPHLESELIQLAGKRGKGRRQAISLARAIEKMPPPTIEAQASAMDLNDPEFALAAVTSVLAHIAPGFCIPSGSFFRTVSDGELLKVETNIDIPEANFFHKRLIPDAEPLTEARILIDVFNAGVDLRLAARLASEMAVSPETAEIAQVRLSHLLRRTSASTAEIEAFQEWVFNDGRAIAEAVNHGHRNFDDVLKVAAAAQKFKDWTANIPEDGNIRKEYLREIQKLDWIDKLPAKAFRWFLFTMAGTLLGYLPPPIGSVAQIAAGAGDALLIDKLVRGWKPNEFVQGPLSSLVKASSS